MRVLRAIATASDDTVATTELPAEGRRRSPRQNALLPIATATTDRSEDSMLHLDMSTEAALAEEQEWADSFQSFLSSVSASSSQPDSPGGSSVNGCLVSHSLYSEHLMCHVHHTTYQQRPCSQRLEAVGPLRVSHIFEQYSPYNAHPVALTSPKSLLGAFQMSCPVQPDQVVTVRQQEMRVS